MRKLLWFWLVSTMVALGPVGHAGSYEEWRLSRFGAGASESTTGPDADPDGDGRSNFLEYALGTNPLFGDGFSIGTAKVEGGYLTLRFPRLKGAGDLSYRAEISGDLTLWQSGSDFLALTTVIDQGSAELVTVRDRAAANNFARRFLRLRVAPLAPGTTISAPTELTAAPLSISAIRLNWKYPTLDASTFAVERLVPGLDWNLLATVPATSLAYLDGGLFPGTTYFYRVTAANSAHTSPPSNLASATTFTDGDFDGIDDTAEAGYGTDPNNPDTDGDGISDAMSWPWAPIPPMQIPTETAFLTAWTSFPPITAARTTFA